MSHLFISYSRKDDDKRDELINALLNAGFTKDDIWYDKYMEGGQKWREEIDEALEESFAVVVLITPNSMASHNVTYEWSWAIGNGTEIMPLLFENTEIHLQLKERQYKECISGIPQEVFDTLINWYNSPADISFLDNQIAQLILPLSFLSCITLWIYKYFESEIINEEIFKHITEVTQNESFSLYSKKLPEFILQHRSALTKKQIKRCRNLTEHIRIFWEQILLLPYYPSELNAEFKKQHLLELSQYQEKIAMLSWGQGKSSSIFNFLIFYLEAISNVIPVPSNLQYGAVVKTYLSKLIPDSKTLWDAIETVRKSVGR